MCIFLCSLQGRSTIPVSGRAKTGARRVCCFGWDYVGREPSNPSVLFLLRVPHFHSGRDVRKWHIGTASCEKKLTTLEFFQWLSPPVFQNVSFKWGICLCFHICTSAEGGKCVHSLSLSVCLSIPKPTVMSLVETACSWILRRKADIFPSRSFECGKHYIEGTFLSIIKCYIQPTSYCSYGCGPQTGQQLHPTFSAVAPRIFLRQS